MRKWCPICNSWATNHISNEKFVICLDCWAEMIVSKKKEQEAKPKDEKLQDKDVELRNPNTWPAHS